MKVETRKDQVIGVGIRERQQGESDPNRVDKKVGSRGGRDLRVGGNKVKSGDGSPNAVAGEGTVVD